MELRGGQGSSTAGATRRRAAAAVRRPAADQILADLPDPVCRWLADSTLTFANQAYCALHGRRAEELVGQRMFDLLAAEPQADDLERLIRRVLASLTPATPTLSYEHAAPYGGAMRWMQWTNRGLFDEAGVLVEVQSVGRDITEYKTAVQHWRDSEARYRLLAEHSRDPIARLGLDGTCLYMSPAFRLMTGYDPDDILGTDPTTHCHPDDLGAVAAAAAALPGQPDGLAITYRTRHRTHGWVWVESTIRPVRDAAGAVVEFILVARDISARQAAETALRESEQRLALALTAADMGLWDWDLDRQAIIHDPRFAAQLGYAPAELNPMPAPWHLMVHPDDLQRVAEGLRAHLEGETEFYVSEHRLRAKSGEWRWVHARGQVVSRTAAGTPRRMLGLQRDITERVRADEALRASEAQLRALIENVPDYVSVVALDRTVTFLNHPGEGLDKRQIVGRRFTDFAAPEDRAGLQCLFDQAVATGAMQVVELRGTASDGAVIWYVSRMVPIVRAGAVCAVTIITSEATVQHEREEHLRRFNAELESRVNARTAELQASLRELESFSYSVSHDLRAPLRAIDGFSQALAEDYAARLDERGLDYLNRVRNAAQRMGELIDDLLGLARVMRKDLVCVPLAIGGLARELAGELERGEPDRRVSVRIDEQMVAVGDPVLLRAALANLLGNAWKFTRRSDAAVIEFGVDCRDGERVFYVRDNGVGFDMAYAAKLFRPFQRLHEPGEFEGTGIGLATVQRIIARHGGWVWAESSPSAGATFFFTLPER